MTDYFTQDDHVYGYGNEAPELPPIRTLRQMWRDWRNSLRPAEEPETHT